jgi:hypothetical protein
VDLHRRERGLLLGIEVALELRIIIAFGLIIGWIGIHAMA